MSEDMNRIRRRIRGRSAHEARARMDSAASSEDRLRQLAGYLGFGRRRVDVQVEEQFSEAWYAMALILTLAGLLLRIDALLTVAISLLVIVAASWVWNRLSFFGLTYSRRFSVRRAFVGETVYLTLEAANHKFLPLSWLRVSDVFPQALPLDEARVARRGDTQQGELNTFWALKWYEKAGRTYTMQAAERGYFLFGPARLESGDLFGLFRSSRRLDDSEIFVVYPRVVPLTSLGLPAKEPFGDLRAPHFTFEDPIRTVGIRDYHPEDDFRRLHWKATARRQQLQTRVLEPATSHNLMVILNVATLGQHWQGVLPDVLEQAVSVAASVCYYGIEQRWPTGILANGALPRSDQAIKMLPGRSPHQITILLEMLAAVTPFATAPIERLITQESPRLPWGSTLVIVTAIVTEALAATLLNLKQVGRRVVLLSLDTAPTSPALRDLLVYQIPRGDMTRLELLPS